MYNCFYLYSSLSDVCPLESVYPSFALVYMCRLAYPRMNYCFYLCSCLSGVCLLESICLSIEVVYVLSSPNVLLSYLYSCLCCLPSREYLSNYLCTRIYVLSSYPRMYSCLIYIVVCLMFALSKIVLPWTSCLY